MKKLSIVFLMFLSILLSAQQVHAYLYATDFNPSSASSSNFYRIDPATGVATLIGNTGSTRLTGLALDTNGVIYTASEESSPKLLTIDPNTGIASSIGRIGTRTFYEGDLSINPATGDLYYASAINSAGVWTDSLYTINKTTGWATKVGDFDAALGRDVSGLQFIGTTLYGLATRSSYTDALLTIDPATGSIAEIGLTGTSFVRLAGMTYDPVTGAAYIAGANGDNGTDKLYSLDLTTGAATYLRDLSGIQYDISGLFSTSTFYPKPVPVPGAIWLIGSGLIVIVSLGRKRLK